MTASLCLIADLVLVMTIAACGSTSTQCPFEVDEALSEVGQSIPDRRACGNFNVIAADNAQQALECLEQQPANSAAELTITRCVDCLIQSTYVVNSQGEIYHVFREDDFLDGGDQRHVSVERCAQLQRDDSEAVRCVEPRELLSCTDKSAQSWK